MKILVSGAAGFVGHNVCEYLGDKNDVIALTRSDLDITNAARVENLIVKESPDLIVNCAVLGVEECEVDAAKARAVNVTGPMYLARAAASANASIVHFSTNYVFDGARIKGFYATDDEARPINIYGLTKLEGERAVVAECERSFIVRTSWVFGGSKANFFDRAIGDLRRGKSIDAPDDIWASVTFVDDLVQRIDEIIGRGLYGTYHVVNSGVCSKYEFALEAARILERDAAMIKPVASRSHNGGAKRPRFTPMKCRLSEAIGLEPLRNWSNALEAFLKGDA